MSHAVRIVTERLELELPAVERADAVLDYYLRNRGHLAPWDPARPPAFYTAGWWHERLARNREEHADGRSLHLVVQRRGQRSRIIGTINFSNFVRGVFQACHLGFGIGAAHQGEGLMTEALRAAIDYVFLELDMHRIMANHQPDNTRSAAVLKKLGFVVEGRAAAYLHIAGQWRDHVLTALVNPDFQGRFLS